MTHCGRDSPTMHLQNNKHQPELKWQNQNVSIQKKTPPLNTTFRVGLPLPISSQAISAAYHRRRVPNSKFCSSVVGHRVIVGPSVSRGNRLSFGLHLIRGRESMMTMVQMGLHTTRRGRHRWRYYSLITKILPFRSLLNICSTQQHTLHISHYQLPLFPVAQLSKRRSCGPRGDVFFLTFMSKGETFF